MWENWIFGSIEVFNGLTVFLIQISTLQTLRKIAHIAHFTEIFDQARAASEQKLSIKSIKSSSTDL